MKISYISGICVTNDAISNSIRDEIEWLTDGGRHTVKLFAYVCDHEHIPFQKVNELKDVIFDPHFQTSDLVVFHFGIYYQLFDLLLSTRINAKRLVIFHNITPKRFVSVENRPTVERSFRQMFNISFADHVACVSQTNLDVLKAAGIECVSSVCPLAIHSNIAIPRSKPSFADGIIRIVFIGRFVRAKGPVELLQAICQVADYDKTAKIKVDMIGNMNFSDSVVVDEIEKKIKEMNRIYNQRILTEVHGNASDKKKHDLLVEADIFAIPTYHEGFCVPLIEALASGCKVVAYNNSNIPSISGGFANLVPTGDVHALAGAISQDLREISSKEWKSGCNSGYMRYAENIGKYVGSYSVETTKKRFFELIRKLS